MVALLSQVAFALALETPTVRGVDRNLASREHRIGGGDAFSEARRRGWIALLDADVVIVERQRSDVGLFKGETAGRQEDGRVVRHAVVRTASQTPYQCHHMHAVLPP